MAEKVVGNSGPLEDQVFWALHSLSQFDTNSLQRVMRRVMSNAPADTLNQLQKNLDFMGTMLYANLPDEKAW